MNKSHINLKIIDLLSLVSGQQSAFLDKWRDKNVVLIIAPSQLTIRSHDMSNTEDSTFESIVHDTYESIIHGTYFVSTSSAETIARLINVNDFASNAEAYIIFTYRDETSVKNRPSHARIENAVTEILASKAFGNECVIGYDWFHSSDELKMLGYHDALITNSDVSFNQNGKLVVNKRTLIPLKTRKCILARKLTLAEMQVANAIDSVSNSHAAIFPGNSAKIDTDRLGTLVKTFSLGSAHYDPPSKQICDLLSMLSNSRGSFNYYSNRETSERLVDAFMESDFDKDAYIDERLEYLNALAIEMKNIMQIWKYATRNLPFNWQEPTRYSEPIDTDVLNGIAALCGIDSMLDALASGVSIDDLIVKKDEPRNWMAN